MQQGVSNREACRIVGIDKRTGQKWRNGRHAYGNRKALPPINAVAAPCGPSRYPREDDRIHIADRLREKATEQAIAAELGRGPSTVSRGILRTVTRRAASTARTRPRPVQMSAGPDPRPARSARTPS
jgi:transposase, IS30 family